MSDTWTVEEFLRNVYGWNDSSFLDDADYLYGHSVREMMQAFADYKNNQPPFRGPHES
jgi:hypothetical protein